MKLRNLLDAGRHGKIYTAVCLCCAAASLFALFIYSSLRNNLLCPVSDYFALYTCSYCIYLYAAGRLVPALQSWSQRLTPAIVFLGSVYRLIMVPAAPSLSTDIYRYMWDGRLSANGINPFRWTPFDSRLAHLRDYAVWVPMEYKPYQTVYMSVSQFFFLIEHLLFNNSVSGFKLVYVLMDIGVLFLMVPLLKKLDLPTTNVIWYAWCPLPIYEIGLSGHQDSIGVFMIFLSLNLLIKNRLSMSAITLAAAALTKGFALLLLPLFTRRLGLRVGLIGAIALVLFATPQILELPEFLHGMKQYLMNVQVNGSIHALIDAVLCYFTPKHAVIANQISDVMIIIAVAWSVWTPFNSLPELLRRSLVVVCVCLLVVPTLFPWYLVWVLPLAACTKRNPSSAILMLGYSVLLSYTFYYARETYWWSAWLEYLPFYGLLTWEVWTGQWKSAEHTVSSAVRMDHAGPSIPFPLEAEPVVE